ncbi:uncharacterized protein LOC133838774 [Drosophila sulfurigaster albostrigata]|uniref:uncharacterized protein LOC133838774 n=1 Tax=Drosophila sulfurigaster albostrigata TaxID=89887 RepID=UPI002D21C780|nr:uncharacterized protein LOC133838774 [Drosophila sulfurigaster albostrigata]
MASECAVGCVDAVVKGVKRKLNCIKQFWHRYLLVEPVLILFWAPTLFTFDRFVTHKACRLSLGYNEAICSAVVNANDYVSDCIPYNMAKKTITTQGPSAEELFVDVCSPHFNFAVCKAGDQAQNLVNNVYLNTLPIVSVFPYIILMFAGGWADRYNKRKAFLILPILGRCLYYIFQLTSSIFYESLPFHLSWYFAIIPSVLGGVPCFLMSAFSYITITTPESDRVLRIGILSVFVLLTNFLSGIIRHLINSEFAKYFGICVGLEIAALLYIILFIKEPKSNESVSEVNDSAGDIQLTNLGENVTNIESSPDPPRRNVLKEFFDPMLAIELFKLPFKRRPNNDRLILLLLILCYFLTAGPEKRETNYMDFHILNRLDWDENSQHFYRLMKVGMSIDLTFFGIIAFTKIWKFSDSIVGISDSLIGILTAVFVVVSRVLFYFADTSSTVYYAGVFDLSLILRLIPIKSLASILNEGDGKLFSFFGILEAVSVLPFYPIYDAFVDAIGNSYSTLVFLFSEVFYVPNVLIFIACYFLMRRRNSNLAQQDSTEYI